MNKQKYLDKLNYYNLSKNTYKINKYEYKLSYCEKTEKMSQVFFDLLNKNDDTNNEDKKRCSFVIIN